MLKEALEALEKLSVEASKPQLVEMLPNKCFVGRSQDGQLSLHEAPPPRSNKRLFSVSDLAECVKNSAAPGEVAYSRTGVFFLRNGKDYRERDSLNLEFSPQVLAAMDLEKTGKSLDQRTLLWTLRTTFRDCLSKAGNLIDSLRKMQWSTSQTVDAEVKRGKASYGSAVVAAVTGIEAVPEYVTLRVPVFASYFVSLQDIDFVLDPDEATKTFKFLPLPGAIETAIANAEDDFGGEIRAVVPEATPVYYGVPAV